MKFRLILLTLSISVFTVSAYAQQSVDDSRRTAIVRAIEKAAPCVVSVNVAQVQAERITDPLFSDFLGFFDLPMSRIREREINSIGSGFVFDKEGHIITNYHVIAEADRIVSVSLPDGRNLEVEYVGADQRTDVAVLRAVGSGFPSLELGDSDNLLIGEWVIAIGNPFGLLMNDKQPTVSVGVVSANHRRVAPSVGEGERLYQNMIQTDAAINPGNSGGPLVNANGDVVGVNTMIFSPSGGSIGLGFAIPINRVKRVAGEIIKYGKRLEPWAGFRGQDIRDVPRNVLAQLSIPEKSGCIVVGIDRDSPAVKAGLQKADVIKKINGETISCASDVNFAIWGVFVGDKLSLEVSRQGKPLTITYDVLEAPRAW